MTTDLEGNEFCDMCEQILPKGFSFFGSKKKVKMKSGVYCETCARIKITKSRGEIGK